MSSIPVEMVRTLRLWTIHKHTHRAVLLHFSLVQSGCGWRARARVAKNYSLPELCDGGGEVGGVGHQPQALVLADGVLHTVFRVPGLLALGPGELRLETLQQVVESPGQDHDVVDVQERHDDEGRISDSCQAEGAKGKRFNNGGGHERRSRAEVTNGGHERRSCTPA